MKIAIYINNENICGVDCRDLINGNPGIGGTEYCILLIAQLYKSYFPDDKIGLFAYKNNLLPAVDEIYEVSSLEALLDEVSEKDFDVLLLSAFHTGKPLSVEFMNKIKERKIKTILWGHNNYYKDFCDQISNNPYIVANVFVGRQQYDRYFDHKIIQKSTYIYNMYPVQPNLPRNKTNENIVTYIGSLVPAKGFHVLAKQWKKILKKVPDAKLYIIGSGNLYNRNVKLGKYGIAEEKYEKAFMPFLLDEQQKILPSVNFLGNLGREKKEIISSTTVGVVNPTGKTETFGISAIDFESMKVPVVTIKKGGFLDTVINKKTGILYSFKFQFARGIIKLLKDKAKNTQFGKNAYELSLQFNPDIIIYQWKNLFEKVQKDKKPERINPNSFIFSELKLLRIINRKIKDLTRFEYNFSVLDIEIMLRNILKKIKKR